MSKPNRLRHQPATHKTNRLWHFAFFLVMLAAFKSFLPVTRNISSTTTSAMSNSEFYAFKINDIRHQPLDLNQFKGKVVLIVNVASKCGFTSQYSGLQKLYESNKDKGFTIIGFPCNQFGGQEPGAEESIQEFCSLNFGVTFPLTEKVDVNGDNAHPIYTWLKSQKSSLGMERIKWNFEVSSRSALD